MNLEYAKNQLIHSARTIQSIVFGLGKEQAHWKPTPEEWSIAEVMAHLYDEERDDFRARIKLIFADPAQDWPGIDPEGWAREREYNKRPLADSLNDFLEERQASIDWLNSLDNPNWDLAGTHPLGFSMAAGHLLAAWVAHDFLHIRQINELHYKWAVKQAEPYTVIYAGEW